jgi:spore coat protein CotH
MRTILVIALLAACQSDQAVQSPNIDDPIHPGNVQHDATVQSHALPDQTNTDEAWLFDDTLIHEVAFTLDAQDLTDLQDLPFEKVVAEVTIDGHYVDEVGVRLRGKIGSFREVYEKPKWKIDFNFVQPGRRFFGLESLSLNNSVADCSYLREKLAYAVYAEAGLVVPRMTWATVTVNGENYGLYQVVEHPDDRFLNRVMANPMGNLYDGKYLWDGGWDTTMLDFDSNVGLMPLEEGIDVGSADVQAVADAIANAALTQTWLETTAPVVDWDNVHRMLAAEQYVDQWDGYALNTNNYRVWIHPDTGLMQLVPWDLDLAFPEWAWLTWDDPAGVLAIGCFNDDACMAEHQTYVDDLVSTVEVIDWDIPLTEWHELTIDSAMQDPRKECDDNDIAPERNFLMDYMITRPAEMRAEWRL